MEKAKPTPEQVNVVLFHRDLDGMASAWAAWKLLGSKAKYIDVQYGEDLPDDEVLAGKHIAIVDFSYKPEPMARLMGLAESVIVLDHHDSVLKDYPDGHPNIDIDMRMSGAMLSWRWFHPGIGPCDAVYLVQDYDLWRWELVDTRAFHYGIQGIPWKEEHLADFDLAMTNLPATIAKGQTLCEYVDSHIKRGVRKGVLVTIADTGVKAWMYNGHVPWYSELGHALINQEGPVDVALIWTYLGDQGACACSLRSRKGGTHVGDLGRQLGGGGRETTAGFTWHGPVEKLFTRIEEDPGA